MDLMIPSEMSLFYSCITSQFMYADHQDEEIVIGYFEMRAKAQVCRLLCEYLQLRYTDKFFTPDEWELYQKNEAKDWIIKALPFLKQGNFVVTGAHGITEFLVRKANQTSLLGINIRDKVKIDMLKSKHDIKDNVIALICQMNRPNTENSPQHTPDFYWEKKIQPRLKQLEASCREGDWFLGYISIMDFIFYEMMNNMEWLFPELIKSFPNLMNLRDKVKKLPAIHSYQTSEKALKVFNPIILLKSYEKKQDMGNKSKMEIQ